MSDLKEVSEQLTDKVSNSTMQGASSLMKVKTKKSRPKVSAQLAYVQPHLSVEQMQSHLDLVALNQPEKKRGGATTKLKKRIQEVSEVNENLVKTLIDKNNEISALKTSVQSLNDVLNSVPLDELRCNSSIASVKILELSKKNRFLRAELETTKNRLAKRENEIRKMEKEIQQNEELTKIQEARNKHGKPSAIEELQSQMAQLRQRISELRNKNTELTNQLKMAQKCLQQEVGENVNLTSLLNSAVQSNWRGRAQQILNLQQKITELKERLENIDTSLPAAERISSVGCIGDVINNNATYVDSHTATGMASYGITHLVPDRYSSGVRKTELLHRSKVEALEKEITKRQATIEDLRGKLLALKVRNKTLNEEVAKYKSKAISLEERTDVNVVNLDEMSDKLNEQRHEYEQRLKEMQQKIQQMLLERDIMISREHSIMMTLEASDAELKERDRKIAELDGQVLRLKEDLKSVCGGFLFSCREFRKEEYVAILDSLESDKNGLLEHVQTLDGRLEQERQKNEGLTETINKQKTRIARAEARIRELEKDLENQTERKKRAQRIADYAQSLSTGVNVTSFVFENSNAQPNNQDSTNAEKSAKKNELADLKYQIEFANEKITLLEEKVSNLSHEKEEDAKAFQKYISNSKQIILDTMLGPISPHGDTASSSIIALSDEETSVFRDYNDDAYFD